MVENGTEHVGLAATCSSYLMITASWLEWSGLTFRHVVAFWPMLHWRTLNIYKAFFLAASWRIEVSTTVLVMLSTWSLGVLNLFQPGLLAKKNIHSSWHMLTLLTSIHQRFLQEFQSQASLESIFRLFCLIIISKNRVRSSSLIF